MSEHYESDGMNLQRRGVMQAAGLALAGAVAASATMAHAQGAGAPVPTNAFENRV